MKDKHVLHICMGSACHQLGAYPVLHRLQELIHEYQLEDQVELKGAFCLGVCARGVALKLDGRLIKDVNAHNIDAKFAREILSVLEGVTNA